MEMIHADLTVVGGGIAGICCAVAAARHGLTVSLINDRPVLGGNASSEVCVGISGAAYNGNSPSVYAREGGLVEEIKLRLLHYSDGRITGAVLDSVFLDLVYNEPNITLFLNTVAHEVTCADGKITSIECIQLASEREFTFTGPMFADCSGDGVIAHEAGASFMYGREGREQFDESLAPAAPDEYTLGDTILFRSVDTGEPVNYVKPDFAHNFKELPFFKNINKKGLNRTIYRSDKTINGHWWIEFGGQMDIIKDNEEITLELRKLVYGFWDYIKNGGDYEDVETLALANVCPIAGKRESRRFIGPHILTQKDIMDKREFPDAVACGGWPMDIHAPKGIYDDAPATEWNFVPGSYNIPFRCLYTKDIANLLLAGRNISASHVAFGSTRVMATGGCMGQAIGTAAYLCKKNDTDPEGVFAEYMEELQEALAYGDQTIIGLADQGTKSISETAKIRASSEKEYKTDAAVGYTILHENHCLTLPLMTEQCDSIEIKVKNRSDHPQTLKVEVLGGKRKENYFPEYKIKETSVKVAEGFDGWLKLEINCEVSASAKLNFEFQKNENLALYHTDIPMTGAETLLHNSEERRLEAEELPEYQWLNKLICFRNVLPAQNIYGAEHVLNPYSRPYGTPNLWVSEGKEEAFLEFTWDEAAYIHEAQVVFNSDLKGEYPAYPIKALVKDYDIIYTDEKDEVFVHQVRNNYMRVNSQTIERKIKKLNYVFKANHGGESFEVFSVKFHGAGLED